MAGWVGMADGRGGWVAGSGCGGFMNGGVTCRCVTEKGKGDGEIVIT